MEEREYCLLDLAALHANLYSRENVLVKKNKPIIGKTIEIFTQAPFESQRAGNYLEKNTPLDEAIHEESTTNRRRTQQSCQLFGQ